MGHQREVGKNSSRRLLLEGERPFGPACCCSCYRRHSQNSAQLSSVPPHSPTKKYIALRFVTPCRQDKRVPVPTRHDDADG
jgi:hypothetical protein